MLLPVHKKTCVSYIDFLYSNFYLSVKLYKHGTSTWSEDIRSCIMILTTLRAESRKGRTIRTLGRVKPWSRYSLQQEPHLVSTETFPINFLPFTGNLHGYVLAKEVKRYSFSWQVKRIINVKPSLIISIILCVSIWLSQLHLSIMGYHSTSCSEIYVK